MQRLDANGKMGFDRNGVSAKRFHSVVSWTDQHPRVVSWKGQQCSAYASRKLYTNMFFVAVGDAVVHGDCFVVVFPQIAGKL